MELKLDIEGELRSQGLSPKSWPKVLETIKSVLSPADWDRFSRLHRNFTGYRSESTLSRFYAFVFTHGLHKEINGFRFGRLAAVLEDLTLELRPGLSILDVGAGAGIVAAAVKSHFAPLVYVVQDPCPEVRDELHAQGFSVLAHPSPAVAGSVSGDPSVPAGGFDLLLCIDSLGEINGDDDGLLAKPGGVDPSELPETMEQRFGFAEKLAPWKPYLAPEGRILLWEPFSYPQAMEAVGALLRESGWQTRFISRAPSRNYLELRPIRS